MPSTSSSSEAETVIISRCYSTKFGRAENLHRKLLYNLMSTIYEYILVTAPSTPTNVMEVCSDMEANKTISVLLVHIHDCLEQIFLNGLRIYKPDVSLLLLLSEISFSFSCARVYYICMMYVVCVCVCV